MNMYGHHSLFDLRFTDPAAIDALSLYQTSSIADYIYDKPSPKKTSDQNCSPPKYRHDGTSPLPLGMDWSPPPRQWAGRSSVWPHDFHTGWSYCVTIPSWTVISESKGSETAVFYRLQIGIQSPEGITTTRGILRRFSDFLNLSSDLKKAFPRKKLPPAPSKGLLKIKGKGLLEERRYSLEHWMEKILSYIDLSRSAPVAIFLELEAAARSSFYESEQNDANSSITNVVSSRTSLNLSDGSLIGGSSFASDLGNGSAYEISELGTPRNCRESYEVSMKNAASEQDLADQMQATIKTDESKNDDDDPTTVGNKRSFPGDSSEGNITSTRPVEASSIWTENSVRNSMYEVPECAEALDIADTPANSNLRSPHESIFIPYEEQHKMNRILTTMSQRLATARTDIEDLLARLDQELAVRGYLTTKVKDLEIELESLKWSGKENLQQAVLMERERSTQMQWDLEEFKRKCMEMELKLKTVQDEKAHIESTRILILQENDALYQELDVVREQIENLRNQYEESELKLKADVKLLVKEVKSLRTSQSEFEEKNNRLLKEKIELERSLQKERERMEHVNAVNEKLLHECKILRNRLEECSVSFQIEEEDKFVMDTSPVDAIDILETSDNRIGLLLAEAQLLGQDFVNVIATKDGESSKSTDDEVREMLTDVLIDNARLRKQVNAVIRCSLRTSQGSENGNDEDKPLRKTVLSKFL